MTSSPVVDIDVVFDDLRSGLPAGTLVTDRDVVASYSIDRAMHCPPGRAHALVRATSTADVQHVLRVASRHRVPVVPQGARSGLSGAANAIDGSILLNVEKMNRIIEIDVPNRLVVTQPGVFNADLSRAVGDVGLFYPPDPSSWEFCSIGGNLATNSGGLCCVKYGVTSDYVLGLEVVLPSGEVMRTGRRTVKGVAGYDLTKLFVGSEGTLGVITEATLMLRPRSQSPVTVAGVFPSSASACRAVADVVAAGLVPSLLEFMDRATIRAVNAAFSMGFDESAHAMLIAQSDAGGAVADLEIDEIAAIFEKSGAEDVVRAADAAEGELLLQARRQALTALERVGTTLIDDVCLPRTKLAEMIDRIEQISEATGLTIATVAHAGDGNFHPNVVFDPLVPGEQDRAVMVFDEIMQIALELGGTITGEHGVGLLKKRLLAEELGGLNLDVHRRIKAALDPDGILNPGKVFDL
jgi:glycolate oxidase